MDRHLSDAMTSYWANFAARGDPNGPSLPVWRPYDAQKDVLQELGERIGPLSTPRKAQMAFQMAEIERSLRG